MKSTEYKIIKNSLDNFFHPCMMILSNIFLTMLRGGIKIKRFQLWCFIILFVLITASPTITLAKSFDCTLTIDAEEHNEQNPAFPSDGCDEMLAMGWYDGKEFQISTFSMMDTVKDGELIDLGMDYHLKVITVEKKKQKTKQKDSSNKKSEKNNRNQNVKQLEDKEAKSNNNALNKEGEQNNPTKDKDPEEKEKRTKKDTEANDEKLIQSPTNELEQQGPTKETKDSHSLSGPIIVTSILVVGIGTALFILLRNRFL
mgnify:CR=1 FL=1